jgi:peptidoglycan/LPS O-acetylase OafA/YrhL
MSLIPGARSRVAMEPMQRPVHRNDRKEMYAMDQTMSSIANSEIGGAARPRVASHVKAGRISALDFTKGALVLIMVLYHWLNYFIGPQGFFYVYLRFLPPSFIFITGFLISQVYLQKYQIADARIPRRLVVRGLKILAIFFVLNALISLLIPDAGTGKSFLQSFSVGNLASIYLTGNSAGGRLAAFTILVPIAYLLILSAGLLALCRFYKQAFHAASVIFLLSIFVLGLNGVKNGILELLTVGLLGVSAGYIPVQKINAVLKHPLAILLAYAAYLITITAWDLPYLLQVVGVCLTLTVIYWLGTISGDSGAVSSSVILLGKYSLLGYIAQIAILQLGHRGLRHVTLAPWELCLSLALAAALTMICIEATDRARAKAPLVNAVYSAVFN